ncbi:hypothetical protein LSTR_LSTR016262 [Laodelphax striatellus]|uniref:Uncharacterized protein n=1 Tax=Laodelphax striatellus TaxID=195883 RepID=A0A482WMS4_LAOST|nr:hypothetical protein LSTR_LSTR016262 [Laodelphax striatellus]
MLVTGQEGETSGFAGSGAERVERGRPPGSAGDSRAPLRVSAAPRRRRQSGPATTQPATRLKQVGDKRRQFDAANAHLVIRLAVQLQQP